MASNWKEGTDDLEIDFAGDVDTFLYEEDCIDGTIHNISRMKMIPKGCGPAINITDKFTESGNSNPFFKPGGTKFTFAEYDSVIDSNTCDSGLDCGIGDYYNSTHDEVKLSSISDVNVDFDKLALPEEPVRISSIGDVDNALEKLKIEQDQTTCASIDLGYNSGEGINSVQTAAEVEKLFTEQDLDGDSTAHLLLIHGQVNTFLQILCLIQTAALLNVQNNLQQALLHLAVILRLPQVVRKLVAQGADIDIRDRFGNTPLHLACQKGDFDCVIALTTPLEPLEVKDVEYNYPYRRIPQDQDIMNYEGSTCLHLAAETNNIKIVNYLLTKCNADINVQEGRGGETILHQGVENNNIDLVKYLLLHRDLHLEATRYDGSSALLLAQGRRYQKMVNLLINAGAVDAGGCYSEPENSVEEDCDESGSNCMVEENSHVQSLQTDDFTYDDFHIGGSLVSM